MGITNLDLQSDPLTKEMCIIGCHLCIDNCPQKALNGFTVNQKSCRKFTYSNNERGFGVCNCNQSMFVYLRVFGEKQSSPIINYCN